jgi:HD-like signal output (HDOD) protein
VSLPDIVGIAGISCVLGCYYLVQAGRMEARSIRYQVINMIGCALILYSLAYAWNLPSAIIQVVWFAISGFGLVRNLLKRRPAPAG